MNTNKMKLNMNEMELVNGGDIGDSLDRIYTTAVVTAVQNRVAMGEPIGATALTFAGFIKGLYREITR